MPRNIGAVGTFGPTVPALPTSDLFDGRTCVFGGVGYVVEGGVWATARQGTTIGDIPIGAVQSWTSSLPPADYVLANGQRLARAAYPEGYAFAEAAVAADGASSPWTVRTTDATFTVPNLAGAFVFGAGARPFGQRGGAEQVLLQAAQSGVHPNGTTKSAGQHGHNITGSSQEGGGTLITTDWTGVAGVGGWGGHLGRLNGGQYLEYVTASPAGDHGHGLNALNATVAHENMPPYLALAWIVRIRNSANPGAAASTQGAFSAYRSGPAALAAGAQVPFDAVEFDVSSWFNVATGRFTPQAAGLYRLSWSVGGQAISEGEYFQANLGKNGASSRSGASVQYGAALPVSSGTCTVQANGTTDYFSVSVQHNRATAWPLNVGIGPCNFQGEKIG